MDMQVHTLDKLNFTAPAGKRLAVLGDPIGHSLSPAMHNAALRELARTDARWADWIYEPVCVPAGQLAEALRVLHGAGVIGINLTLPHKVSAIDMVESVESTARRMGAVNTLIRTETGYTGTNTDGYGILNGIGQALGRDACGADVWLFGAGGAARGIIVALLDAGARRLTVLNRSPERLYELEKEMREQQLEPGDRMRFLPLAEAPMDTAPDALFINATSLGLKASDPSPIPEAYPVPGTAVYDTTYGCTNQLAATCAGRDVAYADGLSMLVAQGARSLEIWTGCPVSAAVMRAAAESALQERSSHG